MSSIQETQVVNRVSGRKLASLGPIFNFNVENYKELKKLGITMDGIDGKALTRAILYSAMDAYSPSITTPSIPTPVQFLQSFLPGFISVVTAPRKIDELIGMSIVGKWEDQEVVFGTKESLSNAQPYSDIANIPLTSYNVNYERRTNLRFEQGMMVDLLEEARAARLQINAGAEKREGCSIALEVVRNLIGFYGYNNGAALTYGFLNDPNLPAYENAPNGASGSPQWNLKTFLEIVADLKSMFQQLRTQSLDLINPSSTPITLAVATDAAEAFTQVAIYGNQTVWQWLKENYPLTRVVSAPELDAANSGDNVAYMYADRVTDGSSTDGGKVFDQLVTQKFLMLGVARSEKGYSEDYSNGTAGALLKRPYAVTRLSGV